MIFKRKHSERYYDSQERFLRLILYIFYGERVDTKWHKAREQRDESHETKQQSRVF